MAEGKLKSELLLISICFLLLSWFLHPGTCACKSIMLSVGYKMWNQIEFDSLSLWKGQSRQNDRLTNPSSVNEWLKSMWPLFTRLALMVAIDKNTLIQCWYFSVYETKQNKPVWRVRFASAPEIQTNYAQFIRPLKLLTWPRSLKVAEK